MAEKGQVIEIKENVVVVRMTRTEACAKCRACIAGMKSEEMLIEAQNICEAKLDEWVEVEMAGDGFMGAILIMYGIPFIGLLSGILLGYYGLNHFFLSMNRELLSCLVGLLFTALAYLWIRSQEPRWKQSKFKPIAARLAQDTIE